MVLQKYENIAGFNLEGLTLRYYGKLELIEWIPNYDSFYSLPQQEGYLGLDFVVDNINKMIWVWQDDNIKTKKQIKKIKNESKESKLCEKTTELFEDLLNYDISSYDCKRAVKYKETFLKLFKYQINEFPLFKQHYYLPQYEGEEEALDHGVVEEEEAEELSNLKKCANCGWIISADTTVCPKCHRSPREKFEKKE